jgi:Icc-related predicted phosphoesterase
MIIYAAADIHGRRERLAAVRETVARTAADVFVAAGDIFDYRFSAAVTEALQTLPVPVIAVRGNSDRRAAMRILEAVPRVTCLHLQRILIGGVEFVGIGGTIPLPFRSRLAFREAALTAAANPMTGPETVLVAHPPPFGACDLAFNRFHVGSKRLRDLVVHRKPRVLICGHIHEQAGAGILGETLVVNCSMGRTGRGALIYLNGKRAPRVEMV